jgi:Kef-type K+ transport system membrane component KefB
LPTTAHILFDLLVVFVAAKAGGELFERLRQPAVVGEILAGMLVGPSGLNLVHESQALVTMALLGIIVLRFVVGLETKPSDLVRVGVRAIVVAVLGVAASFAGGFALGRVTGFSPQASLLIATALVSTSVGVTARVLKDRNLLQLVEARTVVAAAVIDDVLGLFILAIVLGLADGGFDAVRVFVIAVGILAFIVFELWIAPILIRRHRHLLEYLRIPNGPFVVALAIMLFTAALAEQIGLAAVVGASLAGMMLAETEDCFGLSRDARPLYDWLVPYFFALTGMRVDLHLFADPSVLALGVGLTVVAMAAKVIGCGLGAFGCGWRERLTIGVGMIPRAEVALIVAASGLALHVFGAQVYAAIVFAAAATMIISPALLGLIVPRVGPVWPEAASPDGPRTP